MSSNRFVCVYDGSDIFGDLKKIEDILFVNVDNSFYGKLCEVILYHDLSLYAISGELEQTESCDSYGNKNYKNAKIICKVVKGYDLQKTQIQENDSDIILNAFSQRMSFIKNTSGITTNLRKVGENNTEEAFKLFWQKIMNAGEPEVADSEAVNSEAVNSEAVNSEAVNSEAVDSEAVEPEAVDSEAVDSEAVDSEAVEPEVIAEQAEEKRKEIGMSMSHENNTFQQTIRFGCPGTGKSHAVHTVDLKDRDSNNIFKCVFHPEYSYGDFMGKLMPLTDKKDQVTYRYYTGHFLEALAKAYQLIQHKKYDKKVFLVIDEINRGNTAAIFGSVLQLLDREDDGWSSYGVRLSEMEYKKLLSLVGAKVEAIEFIHDREVMLPPNLSIIGTMNTSDESIYYMDSAFKRRWDWEYIDLCASEENRPKCKVAGRGDLLWTIFVDQINLFIKDQSKHIRRVEDKQIGYWFIKAKDNEDITTEQIKNKLMFFLWDSVFQRDKSPLETLLGTESNKVKLVTFGDFTKESRSFIDKVQHYKTPEDSDKNDGSGNA